MRSRLLLGAALIISSSALVTSQREARADVVISRVTVVDTDGAPPAARTVVIRKGVVTDLLPTGAPLPDAEVTVDGRGKFLVPGLWDMHVHLASNPEPNLAERMMLPLFLAHGIVGVRDMGGPLERVLSLRDQVNEGKLEGPRLLTPGPFVDGPGSADPLFRRIATAEEARTTVTELAKSKVDFIKVQANLALEPYDAVVREARARKLTVAGHVPIAIPVAHIIKSGQRSIEHVSPALVGDAGLLFACSRREAELRTELVTIERERGTIPPDQTRTREANLRAELVRTYDAAKASALGKALHEANTWIVPTLIWSNSFRPLHAKDTGADAPLEYLPPPLRKRLQDGRARYLQAATADALAAAAEAAAVSARAVGALHAAGAQVLAGTDTYDGYVVPGFSLHQELQLLSAAGLSPLRVLQTATRNAAAFRGVLDREGTVARGKRADLLLLDADPLTDVKNLARINAVLLNGRMLTRQDLEKLLESVRASVRQ